MGLVLFYTFCALGCSALNDLVFKFFARKERSRGLFVTVIGICGTICFAFLPGKFTGNLQATILWGIICGIFSAVGNILLIESMTKLSAGVCSTIYRLNLALVVPFSMLFLHESLRISQYSGIVLAIAAVLLFMSRQKESRSGTGSLLLPMVMIVTACIFRAGLGLSMKYAPQFAGASENGVNFIIEILWIISGLIYFFIKERKNCRPDLKLAAYGGLSGVLVAGILLFTALALNTPGGKASVVLPIAQMSFLVTFVLSAIFLKEKITIRKIIALACGTAAMFLLA